MLSLFLFLLLVVLVIETRWVYVIDGVIFAVSVPVVAVEDGISGEEPAGYSP